MLLMWAMGAQKGEMNLKVYIYYDEASCSTVITAKDFGEIAGEETEGWEYGNSYKRIGSTDLTKDTIYIEGAEAEDQISFKGHEPK